ncbi:MAG: VOC family protein [Deltaproteobacteria bacterium]|nr:VOC family protein [Deltaproteobacteria bacterium]
MTPGRPPLFGVRHVALFVADLEGAETFWCTVMGYDVEWRPDADNVYLCSGSDNLALHRAPGEQSFATTPQRLDHFGLAVPAPDDVDAWAARLTAHGVAIKAAPRTHRDGSRSLYFHAPDGTLVQIIYHRPLSQ